MECMHVRAPLRNNIKYEKVKDKQKKIKKETIMSVQLMVDSLRDHLFASLYYLKHAYPDKKILTHLPFVAHLHLENTMGPEEIVTKVACLLWMWNVLDEEVAKNLPNIVFTYMQTFWEEDTRDDENVTTARSLPHMPNYNAALERWGQSSKALEWVAEEKAIVTRTVKKLNDLYNETMQESILVEKKAQEARLESFERSDINPALVEMLERRMRETQKCLGLNSYTLWAIMPHVKLQ